MKCATTLDGSVVEAQVLFDGPEGVERCVVWTSKVEEERYGSHFEALEQEEAEKAATRGKKRGA